MVQVHDLSAQEKSIEMSGVAKKKKRKKKAKKKKVEENTKEEDPN